MPITKLLRLLTRPEISEVTLRSGWPPCAMLHGEYRSITGEALDEDAIIAMLASVGGRAHLIGLVDGVTWDFDAPVGAVRVTAGYDGPALKASIHLVTPISAATATAPPAVGSAAFALINELSELEIPKAAQAPRPSASAAPSRGPIHAPGFEPDPERSFDDLVRDEEVIRYDFDALPTDDTDDSEVEKVAAVITTADHALDFAAPTAWSVPPSVKGADPTAQPAASRARVPGKFAGDLLDDLLGRARELNASDIHVVAGRPAIFRVAGELLPEGDAIAEEDAARLLLARVPDSRRADLDRDGSCDFSLVHPAYGRFRVNVSRQRTGYKLTARLIGETVPTLDTLGLPASITSAIQHHQGLIVVTGPTGHGKTTTLAAIVGIINRETTHHVITVEDPVEYVHPTARAVISQREVGKHTKSFQAALKGSLREDPDVIVVGELRDTETVRMALTASETGHLVISTMNTPSAAKAIERLIDLFPPGDQAQVRMTLAGGLRLIISQRLVPSVDGKRLYAAAEVLPGMVPLWNLIRDNRMFQIQSLQQRGKSLGITRLDESLAELVRAGKITMEVARATAEAPDHLEALVAGRSSAQPATQPVAGTAAARPVATATLTPTRVDKPGARTGAKPGAKPVQAPAPAAGAAKRPELGKNILSRAGKLFGSDSK